MAKLIFLKQAFLDLEEELTPDLLKRQRPLIRWSMSVIKEAVVPTQFKIAYIPSQIIDGKIQIPDNCLHTFGIYPESMESSISNLQTYLQKKILSLNIDPYSGMQWANNPVPVEFNGFLYTETRDEYHLTQPDQNVLIMMATIDTTPDGDIMIDENLSPVIVSFIKWKLAEKFSGAKVSKMKRIYPVEMQYAERQKQEYGRELRKYRGNLWHKDNENYKRNNP